MIPCPMKYTRPIHKVLVIRFSSIGDIVLCSPVFRTLKTQKNVEVHWLTKSNFAFINEHNPFIDKIHTYSGDFKSTLAQLKSENFDLVIDLHKNLRSLRFRKSLGCPNFSFDKITTVLAMAVVCMTIITMISLSNARKD